MALFYVPSVATSSFLPEDESYHAVKVLRLQSGDSIDLVDGVGGFFKAIITTAHHKRCGFEIQENIPNVGKHNYKLHIAMAPTKNMDRLEWFVEKATEIGIDEITPIICHNSERKVLKNERLEKIVIAASKQSFKAKFPLINPACSFVEFVEKSNASQKFIAHCYDEDKKLLHKELGVCKDVLVLIGPEGDFSPYEVQKAIEQKFIPVSLGESRLRTETAGIAACCIVAFQ
ncbi:MAG: 16S rRNA (uracil(1498)-N(3))-methyltransferase [Porphyromonadaceae bacterium CG2_30_38_12]|nr:MAG: 16S rRNA (uracil(1498)-N(3))-methyltransferase [Porphyromonadaceae bacterium CG2_30_38_12]